jgi:hypothetical protein
MNSYVQTREKVPDFPRGTPLPMVAVPLLEGKPAAAIHYIAPSVSAAGLQSNLIGRKQRILKGFRELGSPRKSFFERPLLLALLYPMNIELGN